MAKPKKRSRPKSRKRKAVPHWSVALERLNACSEAVAWAGRQKSYAAAWTACQRLDWMTWLLDSCMPRPQRLALVKRFPCGTCDVAARHLCLWGLPQTAAKLRAVVRVPPPLRLAL